MRVFTAVVSALVISSSMALPAQAFINRQKDYLFPYANPYFATLTSAILKPQTQQPVIFELPGLPGRDKVRFMQGRERIKIAFYPQRRPSPLLYVVPGVAGSATGGGTLWLAEHLASKGFSVITVPSPLNWRFILGQSSAGVPGYSPEDAKDLRRVMQKARSVAERQYGLRATRVGVVGYSLGGLNAAFLMKLERENKVLGLERAVMINPPLHLPHAIATIDRLAAVGDAWPAGYKERLMGRVLDVGAAAMDHDMSDPRFFYGLDRILPLRMNETKFLIGNSFRNDLADALFVSEEVAHLGLLRVPVTESVRGPRQEEARRMTFATYMQRGVYPFWSRRLKSDWKIGDFVDRADLLALKDLLASDPAFRMLHNDDDFLTRPQDLAAVADAMSERAIIYPAGGHIGSLWNPRNLADIDSMVSDLR